jgi:hypothetical protein
MIGAGAAKTGSLRIALERNGKTRRRKMRKKKRRVGGKRRWKKYEERVSGENGLCGIQMFIGLGNIVAFLN